ncbi:hypothetical protein WKH14_00655 [Pantoea agglomerans]|uniref:hypothetical protein n=1 Tax=Enterobacter agglomerans TaxID=549 RepID=UPI003C7B7DD0
MRFSSLKFKLSEAVNKTKPFSFINILFHAIVISLALSFITVLFSILLMSSLNEFEKFMKLFWPIIVFQLAALGFVYNIRRHLSEDYYKEAKEQLSKAYENLHHFKDGVLDNDRLRWLTTARMLSISIMLSKRIMMSSHKIMYREEKQFWRMKFVDLVTDFPSEFYAESPKHLIMHSSDVRAPIAESSLVEIYDFMKWPDDYVDPLHDKRFSSEEIESMTIRGPRGLGYLLKAHRELKKKS